MGDGRSRIAAEEFRMNDGDPAVGGEPDASEGILHHGSMPLDTVAATQTVRRPILANVTLHQRATQELVAADTHDMGRRSDPKRSSPVRREPKDWFLEGRRRAPRRLNAA